MHLNLHNQEVKEEVLAVEVKVEALVEVGEVLTQVSQEDAVT